MKPTSSKDRVEMAWNVIERAMLGHNIPSMDELHAAQWVIDRQYYSQQNNSPSATCDPGISVAEESKPKKKKRKGKKKKGG